MLGCSEISEGILPVPTSYFLVKAYNFLHTLACECLTPSHFYLPFDLSLSLYLPVASYQNLSATGMMNMICLKGCK